MKSVFEYIDYRRFLREYYAENKKSKKYFSYRYFSSRAGIKSPVFLKLIIEGKRNLTRLMIEKFSKAIAFNDKEALYFKHLVLFNQGKTAQEKQEHYLVLKSMLGLVKEHVIESGLYEYYDKWYTSVVRELVCQCDFQDQYDKIAAKVFPRITPGQAKAAVELLLKQGLIIKNNDGTYNQTEQAITSGSAVTSLAIRNFNRQMAQLAEKSLDSVPVNKRHVSGITMGISEEGYHVLESEIEAFKERVVNIVNTDDKSEKVYQLNIQLFPLTKDKGGDNG
jgi:uncharacterized protein (TIGR02147 family)